MTRPRSRSTSFNEAGAFLPRKPTAWRRGRLACSGFNEAGAFLPRKQPLIDISVENTLKLQ